MLDLTNVFYIYAQTVPKHGEIVELH